MKVIVVANVEQQEEILCKNTNLAAKITFIEKYDELGGNDEYDAIFYLDDRQQVNIGQPGNKPVIINSVIETLQQNNLPGNFSRINGWPGFLKRPTWEVASGNISITKEIFEQLGWSVVFVKDEPGLVSARVVCMILNEAFFALEEGVSTIKEIDVAMKLGTNYPYGPFEWQEKIGLQNIYRLLHKLSATDKRYSVAPLLEEKYLERSLSK
ncbi:MAG TPA: 3-hydroxyacyl-CoA dehydrogenase family protein [Ginsengibacter sp.]